MTDKTNEGFVLWFTGLPCSGKTTVADMVAEKLKKKGRKIERLDGDIVRQSLSADLGFSREDRTENIRRVTFLAKMLSRNGVGVITTFVSPYRDIRKRARMETTNFIEVYVDCPLEECRKRDVKGMYKLAEEGEIKDFTGVSDPYEIPGKPEIVIHTHKEDPRESCTRVVVYLERNGYI